MSLIRLFFIFNTILVSYANSLAESLKFSCDSTKSCGDISIGAGYSLAAVGALVGPHFIKNNELIVKQSKHLNLTALIPDLF